MLRLREARTNPRSPFPLEAGQQPKTLCFSLLSAVPTALFKLLSKATRHLFCSLRVNKGAGSTHWPKVSSRPPEAVQQDKGSLLCPHPVRSLHTHFPQNETPCWGLQPSPQSPKSACTQWGHGGVHGLARGLQSHVPSRAEPLKLSSDWELDTDSWQVTPEPGANAASLQSSPNHCVGSRSSCGKQMT